MTKKKKQYDDKVSGVIIVGASSGIGRELALRYGCNRHVRLGLIARRAELLSEISKKVSASCEFAAIDLAAPEGGMLFQAFLERFESVDIILFCAGFGEINSALDWDLCRETLALNVMGFTEIMNLSYAVLARQKRGQLAAIASISGLRGFENDSGYSASKGYQILYLEGLARKVRKEHSGINISTILPGFVDTAMAKGDKFFWMCSVENAAECIVRGLQKKRRYIFVTFRWRWIAWLLRILPWRLFERV